MGVFGQPGDDAEGQLPGTSANWCSRPIADLHLAPPSSTFMTNTVRRLSRDEATTRAKELAVEFAKSAGMEGSFLEVRPAPFLTEREGSSVGKNRPLRRSTLGKEHVSRPIAEMATTVIQLGRVQPVGPEQPP